jgi:hypothetical protein
MLSERPVIIILTADSGMTDMIPSEIVIVCQHSEIVKGQQQHAYSKQKFLLFLLILACESTFMVDI